MRSAGFTVIEVLVAILIIAIVTGASLVGLTGSMRSNNDNRVRARAVAAAQTWPDRFRAKSLDFNLFVGAGKTYAYGYNYTGDSDLVSAGDPNASQVNSELQPFKYTITTSSINATPIIWKVNVQTFFKVSNGGESNFTLETIVGQ